MPKHVVARVDDIPPGQRKIVTVAGRSVGVFNVGGEFFAIRNQCPHEGGPLCEGVVSGLVSSKIPGEYDYVRRGEIVRCPWHQWEFDLRSGWSWFDPARTRVQTYETTIESSTDTERSTSAGDADLDAAGYRKGPYEAETYRVEVDHRLVVLHL
ncbi:Ferredoxin subunit of nitrite reductase or a ring-hydroxylating dioxygenase [Actinopolymorpha cephalotaxi]|uniref:3-phenylpropionate/trans-cinnamate dioxygenase ferredoxin subunit n=1 Tax=Actinopolymorpha cephalotaxi TaxID=504797 RepID=A0A1I3A9A4_9ACTN|nr:Rieske (2Fe-2S) protein [Actinopolymorpha cephalotaxi]NYH85278.1 3-phenylpropionate/trans-cinnamate dioxygenase ferredoxin subunit [Actinopolymorpha cephalotaxi]SFH46446.1 Ferredoxin subunit of nitrite reductase or a ring-hydroxylating dioxygenase [Actinopolymorpha cephalotaxi]